MQTFLPYSDFQKSAKCLDNKRLGKQRVECLQILNCLLVKETRWKNHPAVLMWRGYENWLVGYGSWICSEWINRRFKDTCYGKIVDMGAYIYHYPKEPPPWLEDERLHSSHRSNLLRKNSDWYGQYNWTEPNDLSYFWPTKCEDYS